MSTFTKITAWLTIFSTAAVLVLTGMKGYGVDIAQQLISTTVNVMYSFFILSALVILYYEFKRGNQRWVFIFGLPVDILILSVILPLFGIHFHPVILFLFDIYILISYSMYLGLRFHKSEYPSETKIVSTDEN